jgi:predicted amidophosphoribosyltransferase
LHNYFLNIRAGFKRILSAQPCVLCGSMSQDGLWCAACDAALPYFNVAHCPVCALPTPTGEVCGHCLKQPPLFTRITPVFGYSFPLDKLIQGMKYGEQLALAHAFAKKLAQRIDKSKRIALVDDVLTTGASLNALAEAVSKKGAIQISAWVVARSLPR